MNEASLPRIDRPSRRLNVGFRKVRALEEERQVAVLGEGVGGAVAEIERGGMPASAIA
jgi:hypothetical protein